MVTVEDLAALREAAWSCSAWSLNFLQDHDYVELSRSWFEPFPYIEPAATSQAKQFVERVRFDVDKLEEGQRKWKAAAYHVRGDDPIALVKQSLGTAMKVYEVGGQTACTAHEAAELCVQYCISLWHKCEGLDPKELAENIVTTFKGKSVPDLWGAIEMEFYLAASMADEPGGNHLVGMTDDIGAMRPKQAKAGLAKPCSKCNSRNTHISRTDRVKDAAGNTTSIDRSNRCRDCGHIQHFVDRR